MALTEDEVVQILRLVEQSTFDELHLETGELKLVVRKRGCGPAAVESSVPPAGRPVSSAPSDVPGVSQRKADRGANQPGTGEDRKATTTAEREGLVSIKAPLLGTVYRRPSPETPSYVEIGSFVKEDDTVCLIEVMKVFTAVKAGVRGRITEVLVETNEMVEYGQPLYTVKPEAGPV